MLAEVDLLRSLPKPKRNVEKRSAEKNPEIVDISREYGEMYFDGPREYGYGGYSYDGRWVPVAADIIQHFDLKKGDRFLDVGCAKGFLVKDLVDQGIDAFGLDVSEYALMNCHPDVVGRLHLGTATSLPFPSDSFSCAISLNTIHNFERDEAKTALQELKRVAGDKNFVQVDSYRTPEQKEVFESWVLTAKFYDYPSGWEALFAEAGYSGDYYWTIIG